MKKVVLFVEGEGEADAVPQLVKKILAELHAWDSVILDKSPFRVGHINNLVKNDCKEWKRFLSICSKRPNLGGILLILDGDLKKVANAPFCAATVAKSLSEAAKEVGGGSNFSVASVFARQEYESWILAGIGHLVGKTLPDGRAIPANLSLPKGDLEEAPRDAKGRLNKSIDGGYKPTRDQATLTKLLDLQVIRERGMRSFQRLESAVSELVKAIRTENHVVTPSDPSEYSKNDRD